MDIVLGVSMTPTAVRMVLVEGDKADGVIVDHDVFEIGSGEDAATTSAPEQVIAAILGTREGATEGGHRLVSVGVTWRDRADAAALRDALAAHKIDDVMLVSELHAAGTLAQVAGGAMGYDRTALMFLERDTATLSVVQTSDGSIVKVQSQDLHTSDAVAHLAGMIAGLETLEAPPQGVFVVGSGVSVAAIKLELESATTLPVIAPDEAELGLARGAALASAHAPRFEASTVNLASAHDDNGTTAGAAYSGLGADVTQAAGVGYMSNAGQLAYSEVDADADIDELARPALDFEPEPVVAPDEAQQGRKPFLLVGTALTSIFVIGVTALVISLAVSIRPTADQRPNPGENVIVPTQQAAAPAVPEAAVPPAPAPPPETIQAPVPVVQEAPQAPRTVYVQPEAKPDPPAAPAPAPAAPAPAPLPEAPAPVPVAPYIPPPVVAPPVIPPPIFVPPRIDLPRIFRPPWEQKPQQQWPQQQQPQQQWPQYPQQQQPQQQWPQYPQQQQPQQQYPQQQQPQSPPMVTVPPQVQLPQVPSNSGSGSGGGYGSGSGSGSGRGSDSDSGSGSGSGRGSGDSDGNGPLWPLWPGGNR